MEPMKGIVCGILSGDSLIVRFVDHPTQVVCLEYLSAPKFGNTIAVQDEPHGYDSWEFIRDKSIGQRVYVQVSHQTKQLRFHPAFGQLPVIFTRVKLLETDEDLGILACREGWVKIREMKDLKFTQNAYMDELVKAQKEAEAAKRGIWSDIPGTVRKLPVQVNPEELLRRREFDVNIESIKSATTFTVNVIPRHENISISITGCRPAKFANDERLHKLSKEQTRNKFLNRKVRIHVVQYLETMNEFLVYFVNEKNDKAIADSIEKGFAVFNKKTQEYCPNAEFYLQKQYLAMKNKAGFWATHEAPEVPQQDRFQGTITSIKGSNSLYLLLGGDQKRIVTLNNVKVPRFSLAIGCEPLGYEAREYLRKTYLKKPVTVQVEGVIEDHYFGTVFLANSQTSIQEDLCEKGFAQVAAPVCTVPSMRLQQIEAATQRAKAAKIGVFAPEQVPAVVFDDFTTQKAQLRNYVKQRLHCIIEHIVTSTRYKVIIPEIKAFLTVSLNGLVNISQQDKFGAIVRSQCFHSLLQTEADIEIVTIEDYTSIICWVAMFQNGQNIAIQILENGLSEITPKLMKSPEIDQSLKDAQRIAKEGLKGIWMDPTRHPFDLLPNMSYQVTVSEILSPLHFKVQENSHKAEIDSLLLTATEPLTELPLKNECVVYKRDKSLYRARIETVNTAQNTMTVTLIDTASVVENVKLDELYKLPQKLYAYPSAGRSVVLAGLKLKEKSEEELKKDTETVWNVILNSLLFMRLVSDDGPEPTVLLLDKEPYMSAGSLNFYLVQNNMATYVEGDYPPEYARLFEQLKNQPY